MAADGKQLVGQPRVVQQTIKHGDDGSARRFGNPFCPGWGGNW